MADGIERELQFECDDLEAVAGWLARQPAHAALTFRAESDRAQQDAYFDTEDWALLRGGFSLRVRQKGDAREATLKATTKRAQGPQERREVSQVLEEGVSADEGDGEAASRVRLMAGGRPLIPLFEVKTQRRTFGVMERGGRIAEISLDATTIRRDDEELQRFNRVEVEETAAGGIERCAVFVDALSTACGLTAAAMSKFETGLAAAGLEPKRMLDFGSTELDGEASASEYGFALLRQYWRDFIRHEPGTRLGEDPEELHDMRVAARRMRSAMSTFRPVLPESTERLRQELGWAGRCLGEVRDLDVQIEWLGDLQADSGWDAANALIPLTGLLEERRAEARQSLLASLDSDRFMALKADTREYLQKPHPRPLPDFGEGRTALVSGGGDDGAPAVREFARKVVRKRYRQFRRDAGAIEPVSDATLYHAARIRAKRLRYAAAGFVPLYEEAADNLVEAIKAVQDLLGEHQDCAVSVAWLEQVASEHGDWPPATYVRIGALTEQRRNRMAEIRREWPEAFATVRQAWRPLRRAMRRGSSSPENEAEAETEADEPTPHPRREKKRKKGSVRGPETEEVVSAVGSPGNGATLIAGSAFQQRLQALLRRWRRPTP